MDTNKAPKVSSKIKTRKNRNNMLVFSVKDDMFFELNSSAAEVLQLVDSKKTVDDMISKLAKEYGVTVKEIRQDVIDIIERLIKLGVIYF